MIPSENQFLNIETQPHPIGVTPPLQPVVHRRAGLTKPTLSLWQTTSRSFPSSCCGLQPFRDIDLLLSGGRLGIDTIRERGTQSLRNLSALARLPRIIVKHNEHVWYTAEGDQSIPVQMFSPEHRQHRTPICCIRSGISLTGTKTTVSSPLNRIHPYNWATRPGRLRYFPPICLPRNSGDVTHLHIRDSDLVLRKSKPYLLTSPTL